MGKKIILLRKENYFFYRSLGAIVTYRITDEVEPVIELNLSFRGTRNGYDWLQNFGTALNDLNDETELCSTQKVPGSVHNGFLLAYTGLSLEITEFMKTLRSQNPIAKFRINISGHSLGAALASISALHLGCMFEKEILLDRNMIQLTTFGSPRVFSKDAAKFIENLLGLDNILRFVNFGTNYLPDLVTIIPYSLNYVSDYTHLGHECRLYPTDPKFYLGIGKNIKLKTPHPFEGYLNEYVKENECTNK